MYHFEHHIQMFHLDMEQYFDFVLTFKLYIRIVILILKLQIVFSELYTITYYTWIIKM